MALLCHIGLPDWFSTWVGIIYNKAESVARHKNWLREKFPLHCGVRQGCPLSCHLFNLVGQVLLYSMRDHGLFAWWDKPGDPGFLYADDIALLVLNVQSLPAIIQHIQYVGNFSGLDLNLEKTIAFNPHIAGKHLIHGVQMSNTPMKYLGAFLGVGDLSHQNFKKPLHLARKKLQMWSLHTLTLQARVLVAKTFVFSLFTHVLNSVYITNDQLDLIQK